MSLASCTASSVDTRLGELGLSSSFALPAQLLDDEGFRVVEAHAFEGAALFGEHAARIDERAPAFPACKRCRRRSLPCRDRGRCEPHRCRFVVAVTWLEATTEAGAVKPGMARLNAYQLTAGGGAEQLELTELDVGGEGVFQLFRHDEHTRVRGLEERIVERLPDRQGDVCRKCPRGRGPGDEGHGAVGGNESGKLAA